MALVTLARYFQSAERDAGTSLFEDGCFFEFKESKNSLTFDFFDKDDELRVVLFANGSNLSAECNCDVFQRTRQPCRHIWGSVLEAHQLHKWGETKLNIASIRFITVSAIYRAAPSQARRRQPIQQDPWKFRLLSIRRKLEDDAEAALYDAAAERQIVYIIDVEPYQNGRRLSLETSCRERLKNGDWSKVKKLNVNRHAAEKLADPADRAILAMLEGANERDGFSFHYYGYDNAARPRVLTGPLVQRILPEVCRTGRCFLRSAADRDALAPLAWDDGPPWEFWVVAAPAAKGSHLTVQFRRGAERRAPEEVRAATPHGVIVFDDIAARFDVDPAWEWVEQFLKDPSPLAISAKSAPDFVAQLATMPAVPKLELPQELRFDELSPPPRPRLVVKKPEQASSFLRGDHIKLDAHLSFDYDGDRFDYDQVETRRYDSKRRLAICRNMSAEREFAQQLFPLGFRQERLRGVFKLPPKQLPAATRALLAAGWQVEAEGKLYRKAGEFKLAVSSGIDWFELHGEIEFGETSAKLPELLAALRKGDGLVPLGDGTLGILPEDWLKKYGALAGLGEAHDDHMRFNRCQTGFLDALLASMPDATCDETFARVRDELRNFERVEPADPPATFSGELRPYQRDGLGWFDFLEKFGFGGCLADDMGLGKTVQVLALLEARRAARPVQANGKSAKRGAGPRTSLVVAPRSLIFNWRQEAERFTPQLKVHDQTGQVRPRSTEAFADYDLVLTTYGTLRQDVAWLKDFEFDCCILDEAQAVKNAAAESSKAVRLLTARRRLALSGTPVENHLGELWSLFDFLNPGMLGSASVFRDAAANLRNPDEEARRLLARGLRPFILRRTKKQVAKDLPEKLEQTLYCELESKQRKLYDELRDHYRASLNREIEAHGIKRAKIQILEALLRLRQAACHPGLIDKSQVKEPGAKLELLLDQLEDILADGHKVLVFSQFTSLLAILRKRLDANRTNYEYLDGQTRDRQARVERFQNDPQCQLFLISLKAGGLGLNLTAAEYVFLLDPWWNPAVESQAIDRAHRIGQTRQVFAYRLIAKDTVEEKVLQLQNSKRELADAIINADNSLIRDLGKDDLELLLS